MARDGAGHCAPLAKNTPRLGDKLTSTSESSVCGPADPQCTISEPVIISDQPEGSRITKHLYEDGVIYEARLPKGGSLVTLLTQLSEIATGVVLNMWDPADCGDMEDGHFYIEVWVAYPPTPLFSAKN